MYKDEENKKIIGQKDKDIKINKKEISVRILYGQEGTILMKEAERL